MKASVIAVLASVAAVQANTTIIASGGCPDIKTTADIVTREPLPTKSCGSPASVTIISGVSSGTGSVPGTTGSPTGSPPITAGAGANAAGSVVALLGLAVAVVNVL